MRPSQSRRAAQPLYAEDVFFNEPLVVRGDIRDSRREKRYYALGQTGRGRRLLSPSPSGGS
jgi:hypothetical protein